MSKPQKPAQMLQIDPEKELVFQGPFTNVVTTLINLTNPTDKNVCFKVKTTAPKRFCVKPNCGVIEPRGGVGVSVSCHNMLQEFSPDDIKAANKFKFLVQSTYAPDDMLDVVQFWKSITKSIPIADSKIVCVFQMPEIPEEDKENAQNDTQQPLVNGEVSSNHDDIVQAPVIDSNHVPEISVTREEESTPTPTIEQPATENVIADKTPPAVVEEVVVAADTIETESVPMNMPLTKSDEAMFLSTLDLHVSAPSHTPYEENGAPSHIPSDEKVSPIIPQVDVDEVTMIEEDVVVVTDAQEDETVPTTDILSETVPEGVQEIIEEQVVVSDIQDTEAAPPVDQSATYTVEKEMEVLEEEIVVSDTQETETTPVPEVEEVEVTSVKETESSVNETSETSPDLAANTVNEEVKVVEEDVTACMNLETESSPVNDVAPPCTTSQDDSTSLTEVSEDELIVQDLQQTETIPLQDTNEIEDTTKSIDSTTLPSDNTSVKQEQEPFTPIEATPESLKQDNGGRQLLLMLGVILNIIIGIILAYYFADKF